MNFPEDLDADRGVFGISVAAELVGMPVQTLRLYEARGLLEPDRTDGGTRRYAPNDLDRLRRIGELVEAGLNIAGIAMVLDLETRNTQLLAEKGDGNGERQPDHRSRRSRPDRATRTDRPRRS